MVLGAGCSSSTTPAPGTTPAATAPTPAAPVTPPAASNSTVTVKFTGDVTKTGTFEARCAPYFVAERKGIVYEARDIDGWWLQVADGDKATSAYSEGLQSPSPSGGILNGPLGSYIAEAETYRVTYGPGLKSATVKGRYKLLFKPNYINVEATFTCDQAP